MRFLYKVETAFVRLVGATDAQLVMRWDPEQVVTIAAPKIRHGQIPVIEIIVVHLRIEYTQSPCRSSFAVQGVVPDAK